MQALVKINAGPEMELRRCDIPVIADNEVLIKVRRTAICGTDIHIWKWDEWAAATIPVPLIIGHEFCGEIAALGDQVEGLEIGQRVSGEGHLIEGQSRQSRAGRFHLDPGTRGIGVNVDGAFAEYLKLPAFNVIPLPDDIDDELGAILDPLGNAVHTALSFDLLGEDVLITGAGPIGIMAAAVARHAGARHVVITDIAQSRLDLAASIVDAIPVNAKEESLRSVSERLGMRQGFDVGLEMSGSHQALDEMMDAVIMGGSIAILGIPPGKHTMDWSKVIFKSLTIKGIYGREMFETWYKMIAMLQNGLDVRPIITDRFPASDFRLGFETMLSGGSGKVILDWT
ncbi:MAG: L-threonine 3-dehydrogenase [Pseudomonadota bacterium]